MVSFDTNILVYATTAGSDPRTKRARDLIARGMRTGWGVLLLGWSPWAIARVAAFATLGVLLAEPFFVRVFPAAREKLKARGRGAYVVAALSGILADWFLKALLAPIWGRWLRSLLP